MKTTFSILAGMAVGTGAVLAQGSGSGFTNFIRQVQLPSGVQWDVSIGATGETQSPLAINPGGARFELWTVNSTPLTNYLLDSKYVGSYVPIAQISILSEDPYTTIPRTRVDRPFTVNYTISGLLADPNAPAATRSVDLLHHIQNYAGGTGVGLNRANATLLTSSNLTTNRAYNLTFSVAPQLGNPLTTVRGEERFSIFSLPDYQAPASQLASQFIQIWPIASGSINGIFENQQVRFSAPDVTFSLTDLYPNSNIYAQIYKGPAQPNKIGTMVPGTSVVFNETVPQNRVVTIRNWDRIMEEDGQWTLELITATPFDVVRLGKVTFTIDRTIQVNGSLSTMD